jgi:hypothetical protein
MLYHVNLFFLGAEWTSKQFTPASGFKVLNTEPASWSKQRIYTLKTAKGSPLLCHTRAPKTTHKICRQPVQLKMDTFLGTLSILQNWKDRYKGKRNIKTVTEICLEKRSFFQMAVHHLTSLFLLKYYFVKLYFQEHKSCTTELTECATKGVWAKATKNRICLDLRDRK